MSYCVIDLCCGTMFVSEALRRHHPSARVISFDVDPKCGLNIIDSNHEFRLGDVCNIDPVELKREVWVCCFIWASPPCSQYSMARSYAKTPRDLEGVDTIFRACINIMECLRPDRRAMKNPYSGLLKRREVVAPWERYLKRTTYCMSGFPYKKKTAIWTNAHVKLPASLRLPPCDASRASGGRNHPEHAQKEVSGGYTSSQNATNNLHRVPVGLVALLCTSSSMQFK